MVLCSLFLYSPRPKGRDLHFIKEVFMRKFNFKKLAVLTVLVLVVTCMMATTAFAAGTGDVAGAVEGT